MKHVLWLATFLPLAVNAEIAHPDFSLNEWQYNYLVGICEADPDTNITSTIKSCAVINLVERLIEIESEIIIDSGGIPDTPSYEPEETVDPTSWYIADDNDVQVGVPIGTYSNTRATVGFMHKDHTITVFLKRDGMFSITEDQLYYADYDCEGSEYMLHRTSKSGLMNAIRPVAIGPGESIFQSRGPDTSGMFGAHSTFANGVCTEIKDTFWAEMEETSRAIQFNTFTPPYRIMVE